MNYGSLFSGIGTADYAARLLGWPVVFTCENEPYCCASLAENFGGCEMGDITTADFARFRGLVDCICGGFPCTDISKSGKGAGISGTKSRLWGHYFRAINEVRPRYAIIENSEQLPKKGLDRVLCDLASIGYDAEWECFPAGQFGAWHLRQRTWILAYPRVWRRAGILRLLKGVGPSVYVGPQHQAVDGGSGYFEWAAERYGQPGVFGNYDGLARRLHVRKRLEAVGNAMYWPIPYMIMKTIQEVEALSEEEWLGINMVALNRIK